MEEKPKKKKSIIVFNPTPRDRQQRTDVEDKKKRPVIKVSFSTEGKQMNASHQRKNQYNYDGIKRVGKLENASLRPYENGIELWIREINTGEEIRGYIDSTDKFKGIGYRGYRRVYEWNPTYVEFEKKTTIDGSKSEAINISELNLKNKSGIEYFKKIPGNAVIADGIQREYVALLERCLEHRDLYPIEIGKYVLINRGVDGVNVDGQFMSLILDCFIDKTIDENEAKRLFSLCFEQASPKNDLFSYRENEVFFEYMPFLLNEFPDKKDIFFNRLISLPSEFKESGDDKIMGFINDHLSEEDSERIRALVSCLNNRILLDHPEYEKYANAKQLDVLNKERKRLEEERRKKKEEENRRKEETEKIREIIRERGIEYFVHFTDVDNLESIMKYGIFSIDELKKKTLQYECSDENRFDLIHDGISLSVSFPNCEMLYQKIKSGDRNWCILLLDPIKIIEKKCLFFDHNAASSRFKDNKMRDTAEAFKHFFDDFVYGKDTKIRIPRSFPEKEEYSKYATSKQAEIACFDEILPDCIIKCVFANEKVRNRYKEKVEAKGIKTEVNEWYYTYGPYNSPAE